MVQRLRITFSKLGIARYIGHLDLHRSWERALRRGGVELAYTGGFHPQPRIQLASALPLGHLQVHWDTCESTGAPASPLGHLRVNWDTCESAGTPASPLGHLRVHWGTCEWLHSRVTLEARTKTRSAAVLAGPGRSRRDPGMSRMLRKRCVQKHSGFILGSLGAGPAAHGRAGGAI